MTTKLRAASFQDNAVTTAKIAADAITNAKIADGAVQTENVASTVNLGRRNIIINGAMQVAQRGTSTADIGGSGGYFTCDRMYMDFGSLTGRLTQTQSTITDLPGFSNALKLDCTTADTSISAGEIAFLQYRIEGQDLQKFKKGTSDAEKMTISFYVKGNGNATYVMELYDNDNSRQISKTFSVTSSWNRVTLTFDGDTTGAFDDDNGLSLYVLFWLHSGSNYNSGTLSTSWSSVTSANRAVGGDSFFSSTDNEFFITGLQMEVGSQATPFEHRSFGEELALCQRYFFQINGIGTEYATMGAGQMYLTTLFLGYFQTPVPMRTRPSFSLSDSFSNSNFSVVTAGNVRSISSITPTGDNQYLRINAAVTSAGTQGDGGYIQIQSGYKALWSAEL